MNRMFFIVTVICLLASNALAVGEPLDIYFVDVGHGNATLFYQPGQCAMLVDAGPAEQGENLRALLERNKIKTLDYMVVTSPAPEYYFGLNIILSDVAIKELSDNGDPGRDSDGFSEYRQLQERIPYSVVAAGDSWQCGDVKVKVLNPPVDIEDSPDKRSRSLALMIGFSRFKMLMMNDLAGRGERELLERQADLQAMVLTVGNHGAGDSTSGQLLARVRPRMAVISAGRDRRLGFPADSVVRRIEEAGVHLYTTSQSGTVHLRVQPNGGARLLRQ
ncbi:MAG TPA: hypothetical protein DEB25_07180 [Desulfobulbaceae bacterium]|nr:hypothetical protein [Desulfobulbaceae bacterium]